MGLRRDKYRRVYFGSLCGRCQKVTYFRDAATADVSFKAIVRSVIIKAPLAAVNSILSVRRLDSVEAAAVNLPLFMCLCTPNNPHHINIFFFMP